MALVFPRLAGSHRTHPQFRKNAGDFNPRQNAFGRNEGGSELAVDRSFSQLGIPWPGIAATGHRSFGRSKTDVQRTGGKNPARITEARRRTHRVWKCSPHGIKTSSAGWMFCLAVGSTRSSIGIDRKFFRPSGANESPAGISSRASTLPCLFWSPSTWKSFATHAFALHL